MKQFPTVEEQINYWNEIERLELERVSRIQEAEIQDSALTLDQTEATTKFFDDLVGDHKEYWDECSRNRNQDEPLP